MRVRNIDKRFITQKETPNTCTSTQLSFGGAYYQNCYGTFNKHGSLVTLVFGPLLGNVVNNASLIATLPSEYQASYAVSQSILLQAYDSTGANLGTQLGYVTVGGHDLSIMLNSGTFQVGAGDQQGLTQPITITYFSDFYKDQ